MSSFGYVSPEQIVRDRSDFARKGVAKGRSVVVASTADGVLFVADNPSRALHKLSEVLDGIAFAGVGKYNEFENLRVAGVRFADTLAYTYSRGDVTARALANEYARTLGTWVSELQKPLEIELLLAQVGAVPGEDQLFRVGFDGALSEEVGFAVLGGMAEQLSEQLRPLLQIEQGWQAAYAHAQAVLGKPVDPEVALLQRGVPGRAFRRLAAAELPGG